MGRKTSTPAFFAIRRQPAQSFFEIGIAVAAMRVLDLYLPDMVSLSRVNK
jgi:hypothetical protein